MRPCEKGGVAFLFLIMKKKTSLRSVCQYIYTITQIPVQRYVPGPAEDLGNVSVSGINGTADVLHHTEAEVRFPYTLSQYGGFSHTDEEINSLNP